jgi:hypothetical protein
MTDIRTSYHIVLRDIETGFTKVRNVQLLLEQIETLQAKYEAKKPEGKYLIVRFERSEDQTETI